MNAPMCCDRVPGHQGNHIQVRTSSMLATTPKSIFMIAHLSSLVMIKDGLALLMMATT
jgi:hypothetical protein